MLKPKKATATVSVYDIPGAISVTPSDNGVDLTFQIDATDKHSCFDLLHPAVITLLQDDPECQELGLENCYAFIKYLLAHENCDLPRLVAKHLISIQEARNA